MGLKDKKILLAVSGGIAAYKSAELCRQFIREGASVRVVMTRGALAFITPMTFQALSGNSVHTELLDPAAEAAMGHIELARWADLVLIAPASAGFLARLAAGMADDLLSTLCLATSAPVVAAPAMNQQMWANAATRDNMERLQSRGIALWGPASGDQACGEVGPGRMLEPSDILDRVRDECFGRPLLKGRKVVITAGPTREAIDPVRYVSNHSSGKMGFALAEAARALGAEVVLVAGPVSLATPAGCTRIDVESAREMLAAVESSLGDAALFIGCAAVADFRPREVADQKLKKPVQNPVLELEENPDILATVTARYPEVFSVGFAAETGNLLEHAAAKLDKKKVGLICANDVTAADSGFNSDKNTIVALWRSSGELRQSRFGPDHKKTIAGNIIRLTAELAGWQ